MESESSFSDRTQTTRLTTYALGHTAAAPDPPHLSLLEATRAYKRLLGLWDANVWGVLQERRRGLEVVPPPLLGGHERCVADDDDPADVLHARDLAERDCDVRQGNARVDDGVQSAPCEKAQHLQQGAESVGSGRP